jgi:hypothetical protein
MHMENSGGEILYGLAILSLFLKLKIVGVFPEKNGFKYRREFKILLYYQTVLLNLRIIFSLKKHHFWKKCLL